ncbi:fimbrial protein [Citrobacter arsenatis]|uniref:fimbrial protein n=1 Tax=Citrobacter arsenatis TaxID=2546350 RepID=UPI00300E5CDC
MKLKNTAFLLAVGSSMLSSIAVSAADNNSQGVSITGQIHGGKCDVVVPATLELGEITPEVMTTSDVTPTKFQVFTIGLSNCLQGTSAAISILGTTDSIDTSILKNDAASPAGNVGIAFWDIQKKQIKVNQDLVTTGAFDNTTSINLLSGMVKVSNSTTVTPGNVSSSAQIKVDYL